MLGMDGLMPSDGLAWWDSASGGSGGGAMLGVEGLMPSDGLAFGESASGGSGGGAMLGVEGLMSGGKGRDGSGGGPPVAGGDPPVAVLGILVVSPFLAWGSTDGALLAGLLPSGDSPPRIDGALLLFLLNAFANLPPMKFLSALGVRELSVRALRGVV